MLKMENFKTQVKNLLVVMALAVMIFLSYRNTFDASWHLDEYHPLRIPDLGGGDPSAHPVLFLVLRQRVPEVTDNCGELLPKVGDPL